MSIKTTIHNIDKNSKCAVLSIDDGDYNIMSRKNVKIELNEDGSANTSWLTSYTKYYTLHSRLKRIDKTEDDLV